MTVGGGLEVMPILFLKLSPLQAQVNNKGKPYYIKQSKYNAGKVNRLAYATKQETERGKHYPGLASLDKTLYTLVFLRLYKLNFNFHSFNFALCYKNCPALCLTPGLNFAFYIKDEVNYLVNHFIISFTK
mgnify:CR=1 FL=1